MTINETKKQHNFIDLLINEASAYQSFDRIEALVEDRSDLSNLPMQPLYIALKNLPLDKRASSLSKLSKEQRRTFLDIDLWAKDQISISNFENWILTYALNSDTLIKYEFVTSSEFALFLKARFNIWTFDLENPQYPDHDNYFLTEDNLLLFEYDDNCEYVEQVKHLIKVLYTEQGVEKAYSYLFKITADQFEQFSEDEYQSKKNRLRDYGLVDYYDALEINSSYTKLELVNHFIDKKTKTNTNVAPVGKQQVLPYNAIKPYQSISSNLLKEISLISNNHRNEFLQFNFIRLINAIIELNGGYQSGSVAITKSVNNCRTLVELGLSHLKATKKNPLKDSRDEEGNAALDLFDFTDLYRIGNSLVSIYQKSLKKDLGQFDFSDNLESFSGPYWENFLLGSFDYPLTIPTESGKTRAIDNIQDFNELKDLANTYIEILPFIIAFHKTFNELVNDGKLHNSFYLNYEINDINFEALIISSFANLTIGSYLDSNNQKMGITIKEFKNFVSKILTDDYQDFRHRELTNLIHNFQESFGMNDVNKFENYLTIVLKNELIGYNFEELEDKDFKHIGGPIILSK